MATYYCDGSRRYLELHALRAPVGGYTGDFDPENDPRGEAYNVATMEAIRAFEARHHVTIYTLGRSGRHICIEDTAQNRRRYTRLSKAATEAAHALWASMRTPKAVA